MLLAGAGVSECEMRLFLPVLAQLQTLIDCCCWVKKRCCGDAHRTGSRKEEQVPVPDLPFLVPPTGGVSQLLAKEKDDSEFQLQYDRAQGRSMGLTLDTHVA